MGNPFPWIQFELHDCLDGCALEVQARINGDMVPMCSPGHSCHKLPLADIDVLAPRGLKVCPDVLEPTFFLGVGKTHQGRNVLFPIPLFAFASPPSLVPSMVF